MKKLFAICLLLTTTASVLWAQPDPMPRQANTAVSRKYHEARENLTKPLFGVAKIEGIVKKLKRAEDDSTRMSNEQYNALTDKEKFVYCMLHGEDFTQNCAAMGPLYQEERRIFGYIPGPFRDVEIWSHRQMQFMVDHRALMVAELKSTIQGRHHVGANIKNIIVELKLNELIPTLKAEYQRKRKDQDILSLMILLMKDGKYKPFMKSALHQRLYGKQYDYWASIPASVANQNAILNLAMAYFRTRT